MANPMRLQPLQGMEERCDHTNGASQASFAERRAAVLSYHQLVAGLASLRSVASRLVAMPRPMMRVTLSQQVSGKDLARDPLSHPVAPPRPPRAAKLVYSLVTEPVQS